MLSIIQEVNETHGRLNITANNIDNVIWSSCWYTTSDGLLDTAIVQAIEATQQIRKDVVKIEEQLKDSLYEQR